MSTLELENIKHADASSNALELAADGSLTLGTVSSNIVTGGNIDANGTLHQFGNGASTYVQINNASSGDISSGYNIVSGSNTTTSLYGNADEEWTTLMSGGSIGFRVNQNVSGFNPMNIDTSGRVTTPYQPAFVVSNSSNVNVSSDSVINWNQVDVNIGSHFNTSNNRFVCPVAGVYSFSIQVTINGMSSPGNYNAAYFKVNGSGTGHRFRSRTYNNTSEWSGISGTALLRLNANDYVELTAYSHTGYMTWQGNEYHFYGYLIG